MKRICLLIGIAVLGISLLAPMSADAYRKASKREIKGMKRGKGHYQEKAHAWYVSTKKRGYGVKCVDTPGYNAVFGRTYRKRNGRWKFYSAFNTGNVEEGGPDGGYHYPKGVYDDLLRGIRKCAKKVGKPVFGAEE